MPMEFKPSEVGVIVANQEINGIPYLLLVEAGNRVDAEVLSWFLAWAVSQQLNVEWQVGEKFHQLGSMEFINAITQRAKALDTAKKLKDQAK